MLSLSGLRIWMGMALLALCSHPTLVAADELGTSSSASAAALGHGFEDRYVDVRGVRLHYVTAGHGPAVLLVPGWPETWWAWRHLMPIFRAKVDNAHSWHFMFNQLDDLPELLGHGREREFLSWLYSNYAYKPDAVAMDEYIRVYSTPGAMRAGFAYYRPLAQTIEQNHLHMKAKLAMPILAVGGDHGTADTAEQTLKPYASDLRGAVLAACGHYVPEECPQDLLARLLPFLAGRQDQEPRQGVRR
jgi:pimeloyl-ACP methyl ester carboxylesterase